MSELTGQNKISSLYKVVFLSKLNCSLTTIDNGNNFRLQHAGIHRSSKVRNKMIRTMSAEHKHTKERTTPTKLFIGQKTKSSFSHFVASDNDVIETHRVSAYCADFPAITIRAYTG